MLALLVPLVSLAASASDGEDNVAAPNYGVTGYVIDTGKIAIEGVTVTITDNRVGGASYTDKTDADGKFTVIVPYTTNLSISFEVRGHTLIGCPNTTPQPDGTLTLNLSTAQYSSSSRIYKITSDKGGMQCAIMAAISGKVSGIVSYENGPLKNMTVSLTTPDRKESYAARTGDNGYFNIECPIGTYSLTAGGQGFNWSEGVQVNVTSGTTAEYDITLIKEDLTKYMGMDAAHLLMLIGVIVGIFLAAAAWFLSKRMNDLRHIEVFDDRAEEDEDLRDPL
jgi:hypothetical protein